MTLSEIKLKLKTLETIAFELPNGQLVPSHFHITEVGKITKDFIDCGGAIRHEEVLNFQLWEANDYNHRLHPEKLLNIIELSQKTLNIQDLEIEVEYQGDTIRKFGLDFNGKHFLLTTKQTACLAIESCGIPVSKPKVKLSDIQQSSSYCTTDSGCC